MQSIKTIYSVEHSLVDTIQNQTLSKERRNCDLGLAKGLSVIAARIMVSLLAIVEIELYFLSDSA